MGSEFATSVASGFRAEGFAVGAECRLEEKN